MRPLLKNEKEFQSFKKIKISFKDYDSKDLLITDNSIIFFSLICTLHAFP